MTRLVIGAVVLAFQPFHQVGPAAAQTPAANDPACARGIPVAWTPQERWVWARICAHETADLNEAGTFGPRPDPRDASSWNPQRRIGASFLESVILDDRYVSKVAGRPIRIGGAWFDEPLRLADTSILRPVLLTDSRFEKAVDLTGVRVGTLGFEGSAFANELNLNSAVIGGPLILRGATLAAVDLVGAKVEGNVELDGASSTGKLDMSGIRVAASVFFRRAVLKEVTLVESEISATIESDGATVEGDLVLDRAKIGGSLYLVEASFGSVEVNAAKVASLLDFSGSNLTGDLNMDGVSVTGSILLVGGMLHRVTMVGGTVEGSVVLVNTTIDSLELRNSAVKKELRLADGGQFPPRWTGVAILDLRSTSVGTIDDSKESWPNVVRLAGFTYQQPRGSTTPEGSDLANRDFRWYLHWLSHNDNASFSAQPHLQLEAALRQVGRRKLADRLAIDRRDHEPPTWLTFLHRWTVGYGYRPEWAVGWLIGLVLAGWLIVVREPAFRKQRSIPGCLLLSIDNIIPLVQFRKANADVDLGDMKKARRCAFYALKAAGYVLGGFLLTALAKVTSV